MAEEKKKITEEAKKPAQKEAVTKPSNSSNKPTVKAEVKKPAVKKEVKKTPEKDVKVVGEVVASARFVKVAPRKVRLVLDQIRSMEAEEAVDRLRFIKKAAVSPVAKLLNSAIANAENNFEIDKKDLFIKTFTADDGPIIKRFRPRAQGRSAMIRKRTSNINLILGVKEGATKKVEGKKPTIKEEVKVISHEEVKKDKSNTPDSSGSHGSDKGKGEKGFMKGFFQRKTG